MSARKSSYIFEYRFTILGAPQVGKSAIISQLDSETFIETYDPTSENHVSYVVKHNDVMCVCLLVDTAGRDDFPAMRRLSISKSNAFIVVYAINNRKSYEIAKKMVDLVKRIKKDEKINIIIVGNKIDLPSERVVSFAEVLTYTENIASDTITTSFIEVTAKENVRVKNIINYLLDMFNPRPPPDEFPGTDERKFSLVRGRSKSRRSSKGLIDRKSSLKHTLNRVASISDSSIEKISNLSPKLPFRRIRLRSDSHSVIDEAKEISKSTTDSPLLLRQRANSISTAISSPILMCHSINLKRQKLQSIMFKNIESSSSDEEITGVNDSIDLAELEERSAYYTPEQSPTLSNKFSNNNNRPELRRFASCPATNDNNFVRNKKSRTSISDRMKNLFRREKSSTT